MEPIRDPNASPADTASTHHEPSAGVPPEPAPTMPPLPSAPPVASAPPLAKAKADVGKRFIAMIIDAAIAVVLGFIPFLGGILGAAYFLVRDGLEVDFMDRRSLGKKVMKLRPVRLDGQPMDLETSVKRNWMWGLGAITSLLVYIPILGWALIPVVGLIALAIGIFEIYKVLTDAEGRRWGDELAGTKVIEVAD